MDGGVEDPTLHYVVHATVPFAIKNAFVDAFCNHVLRKLDTLDCIKQYSILTNTKLEFLVNSRATAAALHDGVVTCTDSSKRVYNVRLSAPCCEPPPPPPRSKLRLLNLPLGYDFVELTKLVERELQITNAVIKPDFVKFNGTTTNIITSTATVFCDLFQQGTYSSRILHLGPESADPIVVIDVRLGDSLSSSTAGADAFRAARTLVKHLGKPDRYRKRVRQEDTPEDVTPTPTAQPAPATVVPEMSLPAAAAPTTEVSHNDTTINSTDNGNNNASNISNNAATAADGFTTVGTSAPERSTSPSTSSKKARTGLADDDMDTSALLASNPYSALANLDDELNLVTPPGPRAPQL